MARVYGPAQPTTSNTTLYTAPAPKRITDICVSNTTGSAATITLQMNGSTASKRFLPAAAVPANTLWVIHAEIDLDATNTIQGLQGTSGAITVIINAIDR